MASDYGLNFGFRRSDESVRVAEGRFRTPVTGALLQGSFVEVNPASAGYLKQSATNPVAIPGYSGLLVSEEFDRSLYEADIQDSFMLGTAKANRLAVVSTGAGTKFWIKNTGAQTRADGRVIAAVTMFSSAGALAVGDGIAWDGSKYVKVGQASTTNKVATVTFFDATAGLLEAVLVA